MPLVKRKTVVLVVGSGGREHALAWKLAQSTQVKQVMVAPGNGGTAMAEGKVANVPAAELDVGDRAAVVAFCQENSVDLVVVGPEMPLVDGLCDDLRAANVPCFGPSAKAARLEGSKAFSKAFMVRHGIDTASHRSFTDFDAACAYVSLEVAGKHRVVVKASGLAAGKGVLLPETTAEALAALRTVMVDKAFGAAAGAEVVVEEFMEGPEVSVFAFCDGERVHLLPASQDHKRALDGDLGPNTGGMGAYCPAPVLTPEMEEHVKEHFVQRTVDGARQEGFPFIGLLYTGLMLTKTGPRVLEYNCRFGDPETQAVLLLLQSDLFDIMRACAIGDLPSAGPILVKRNCSAATVVAAAGGYPGTYGKGEVISGVEAANAIAGVHVFQAGTKRRDDGALVSAGGRVLVVSASAPTLGEAVMLAYAGMKCISFSGMQFRSDIGHQALAKSSIFKTFGDKAGSTTAMLVAASAIVVGVALVRVFAQ